MSKEKKVYELPENVIELNIPIPKDDFTNLPYEEDTFEYHLIQHYNNGEKLPDFSPFIETRKRFQEFGTYTPNLTYNQHPDSTYRKFWKQEELRCINGMKYEIDGKEWFIPGYLYWYWNFTPIHRSKDLGLNARTGKQSAIRIYDFPDVFDIDYFWFMYLHEARTRGQHAVCLKKRGIGASFKAMCMITRNFHLIPRSKSYAIADTWDYLTLKDGLLIKVGEHISFIDEHTEFGKKRHYKDTDKIRRASFKEYTEDGMAVERGYMSEIYGIALEGKPDKVRGLRGQLILYEESGNNDCLQSAWEISRSSVEEGGSVYGQLVAFGTGGTVGQGFVALERMMRNPHEFNIYGLPNSWEKGRINQKVGFFIPDFVNRKGNYDGNGNSDIFTALQEELHERESKKGNPLLLRQRMAEHPFTIDDAIMRVEGSPFDISLIREQIAELEVNPLYRNCDKVGNMIITGDGSIDFREESNCRPIRQYPTIDKEPDGCIIIYELPVRDGHKYVDMYVGGTDPVDLDRDDVGDTYSLASTIIVNRMTRRIVAEYTGRPRLAETYYEQTRRLLLFYNAQTLFEANLVGMYKYFQRLNCTHLLAETPDLFRDKFGYKGIADNKGIKSDSRGQVKAFGRELINKWSTELIESEVNEVTGVTKNIFVMHSIRSKPILQEMKDWSKAGNFDRIDALCYAMIHLEEKSNIAIGNKPQHKGIMTDKFWGNIAPVKSGRYFR